MQTAHTANVLQWEMYGVETVLSFSAMTTGNGFEMTLERDNARVLNARAADVATLFRVSSELRQRLNHLGYGVQPQARRATIPGGVCWGPTSLLDASLVRSLSTDASPAARYNQ